MIEGIGRRRLLAAGAAVVGAGAAASRAWAGTPLADVPPGGVLRSKARLPRPFQVPLPVPPVLEPTLRTATTDYYNMTQREARLEILPGLRTNCWTYDGYFPGPTIVSRSGRRTVVTHRNELPQPTVVHLHGGHTPAESDGYPIDLTMPVGSKMSYDDAMAGMPEMHGSSGNLSHGQRSYTYPMLQRAATLWYHDHRMGYTGPAVYRGLAGFHLLTDDEEDGLDLPRGSRDIPLLLADRAFAENGALMYPASDPGMRKPGVVHAHHFGVMGDVILVNGAPWPVHRVRRQRYRLRFLNGCNVRDFRLELDPPPPGGKGLLQIGSDGGLLGSPLPHDSLRIAPAERFDVIVDFARYRPGTKVRLINRFGSGSTAQVMRFDVSPSSRKPHDDTHIPRRLSRYPATVLDPSKAVAHRTFAFRHSRDGWTINNFPYKPGRSLADVRLGKVEIWKFTSVFFHSVHVHLDAFRVLSRNGKKPGAFDAGWKDTVATGPGETVEVAVRFTDYTGKFMIHCHNLEHEDMAMMADFSTY
ncbi:MULTISPECIES: multicopper oxidase domain-containing protein [unclassified Streptomyces]|uniref:multicopper oxidase family protein n=1 Tax=unclassified Streptomyces TaxID=2593676 RepID=UPI000367E158|nr:multicopper oxidase domain-containing protein [Streptomyces sp. BoleA5]